MSAGLTAAAWWIIFYTGSAVCLAAGLGLATLALGYAGRACWRKLNDLYTLSMAWRALRAAHRRRNTLLGDDNEHG
ncbi:MAG: hypothetical protein ACEQSK_06875 [Sphingomonadaceae bacterium]